MRRSLSIRPQADRDIDALFVYLAQDNPDAADRFLSAVQEAFELLVEMPQIGSLQQFDHQALKDLRRWPVKGFEKHLIFYQLIVNRIEIVRVLHAARDLGTLFDE
ncbi:MAG: type II toxin-antitoxin system RelE/ParE family toxin [Candidatus Latescibacteria bacterium]|nr:type II toxin-antitoxin system RelE/ParE family toxin [Candidatus Latescibacterota bacterium]